MHTAIIGRTASGKSALAKQIGSCLREDGFLVAAFNPTCEAGYSRQDAYGCAAADWETNDPDEFIEYVENGFIGHNEQPKFLIIDEAHDFFQRGDNDYLWVGTEGRHYGLNLICCTQRGALLNPTIRGQCAQLYLFRCSLTDARFMADEHGHKELLDAPKLPIGHYYKCSEVGLVKGRVF